LTRKNRNRRVYKKFDTQTCENDTFACEILKQVCGFLNIFLVKYAQFPEHTPEFHFDMREYDFYTHDTHECDFYTQSATSTCTSVTPTRTSIIPILMSLSMIRTSVI
jgi:hypothetical protein